MATKGVQGQIDELVRRVDALENALSCDPDADGCTRIEIGPGAVAFRTLAKPFSYYCANCRAKGEKSVLHQLPDVPLNRRAFGGQAVECPTCKATMLGALSTN